MAARIWTVEQKGQQRQAIKRWKPWERSTGPKTLDGKTKTATNAFKGGHRTVSRVLMAEIKKTLREYADYLKSIG